MKIGDYNTLSVAKIVEFGVYLSDGETTILMPKKYLAKEPHTGDMIDCFVYMDSEDRPIATSQTPLGKVDDLVFLECVSATTLGAFLNWGLEKDLFVPFKHQKIRMQKGKKYLVKILYDEVSKRLLGSNDFGHILHGDCSKLKVNDELEIIPYEEIPLGFKVVAGGKYLGMIYKNQIFRKVEVGVKLTGFVTKIREDKKVDMALQKGGVETLLSDKEAVFALLKKNGGFMAVTAKTPPSEIMRIFNLSKKSFKAAVGMLYKDRRIMVEERGIRIVADCVVK